MVATGHTCAVHSPAEESGKITKANVEMVVLAHGAYEAAYEAALRLQNDVLPLVESHKDIINASLGSFGAASYTTWISATIGC